MNIRASVNYHIHSDTAQAFRFDVDGIVGNLISPELATDEVKVQDVRSQDYALNFGNDGILFADSHSVITDFDKCSDWQTQYNQEIVDLLAQQIDAHEVIVFDHTLRIDTVDAVRKPARNVHNDYSTQGANQRLIDLIGSERATEFQKGRFGFVNVWRPIERAITSSPLGFIHPRSIEPKDWMTIELIYPDRKGQILGVGANPKHEWFYQSNMTPNEVVIFNIYDNRGQPHLAHSALDIANQPDNSPPRKSIETRTLVRYNYVNR